MMDAFTQDKFAQDRFAQGCTEATLGYAAAATAALTELTLRAFDFWSTALEGLVEQPEADVADAQAPPAAFVSAPDVEPPFGMAMADWCPFPWMDQRRMSSINQIDFSTPPIVAWMAMANAFPLRGTSTSWPFAQLMIESGVPRTIAWPAAEASAAALDAADVATDRTLKVLASYQTEGGYAMAAVKPSVAVTGFMMALFGVNTAQSFGLNPVGFGFDHWLSLFTA
jgi:hypothetical protein